ncbi:hypothetical protein WJX77_006825 [Trebouxia sp. C0004]
MNPEMMKLAMEQMSKMSPEQMADMQRTMGNLSPAQMQAYQQQAASISPDDIRRARTQMSGMTPDQLQQAAGQASASLSAQEKYQLDGANSLKVAGNQLHSSKQYAAAIDKYIKAKSNLTGQPSDQAKDIRKACMLNICSCHLNLGQLDFCAKECTEVLTIDASNRKALYRRGQAYSGLSRYAEAVQDLTKALDMSPASEKEVVAAKLKEAQQGAAKQAAASQTPPAVKPQPQPHSTTPVVPAERPSNRSNDAASSSSQAGSGTVQDGHVSDADSDTVEEIPAAQPQVARQQAMGGAPMGMPPGGGGAPTSLLPGMDPEQMRRMMQDPSMMQQAANMMGSMDPAQLESMSRMAGASAGMQISPEMLKSVTSMMSSMSPEMMQSMMSMASSSGAAAASGQQTAPGQQMPAGGPQTGPDMMDQIQQRLNDPATADLISAFTQTMKSEDLAGMLKSGGMDVTPEQAAQYLTYAKRISPANVRRLLRLAAYGVPVYTLATQSTQFFKQYPLAFWAIVVLLLALFLKFLGWV